MMFRYLRLNSITSCFELKQSCQSFHLSPRNGSKSLLSKLRKKTGLSFANCRKALELHENDFEKSYEWLKAQAELQGWEKALKVKDRPTVHGLVGIAQHKLSAIILELNCETDFVARNSKFQDLTAQITHFCHSNINLPDTDDSQILKRWELSQEKLNEVSWKDNKTIADLVALNIGQLGENISVRRATYMKIKEDEPKVCIRYYIHGSSGTAKNVPYNTLIGKYGALVALRQLHETNDQTTSDEIGRQLGQHVVGMNPRAVGDPENDKPNDNPDEEDKMIFQEFIFDSEMNVSDFLKQSGTEIIDFVRYECGEKSTEET